jgi:hypothetical protein
LAISLTLVGCNNDPLVPTLVSIEVTGDPTQSTHLAGTDLDLSGLTVTATYSNGSTTEIILPAESIIQYAEDTQALEISVNGIIVTITGYDKTIVGIPQPLTITVGGKADSFYITVTQAGPSALNTAIIVAQAALDGVIADPDADTPNGTHYITTAEKDNYQAAINDAQDVYDDTTHTPEAIIDALQDLAAATGTFNTARAKTWAVNYNTLAAAIATATTHKDDYEVNDADSTDEVDAGVEYVSTAVKAAYASAIATANNVLIDTAASQNDVDGAKTALDTATDTFDDAIQTGAKPAGDPYDGQVYLEEGGEPYTGSGIVAFWNYADNPDAAKVGTITGGMLVLDLLSVPGDDDLWDIADEAYPPGEGYEVTADVEGVKIYFEDGFAFYQGTTGNWVEKGYLWQQKIAGDIIYAKYYYYSNKTCSITGKSSWKKPGDYPRFDVIYNLDVTAGWNEVYFVYDESTAYEMGTDFTTDTTGIPLADFTWYLALDEDEITSTILSGTTWKSSGDDYFVFSFDDSTMTGYLYDSAEQSQYHRNGSYVVNGTSVQITFSDDGEVLNLTFSGNTMTTVDDSPVVFTKQL